MRVHVPHHSSLWPLAIDCEEPGSKTAISSQPDNMQSNEEELGTIATNVGSVLASMHKLRDALKSLPVTTCSKMAELDVQFTNEFVRFKLWAGSQGALPVGSPALDRRLRQASHLHKQVNYLLRDAVETLENAVNLVIQLGQEGPTKPENISQSSILRVTDPDISDGEEEEEEPELEKRLITARMDVGEVVDCLMRLCIALSGSVSPEPTTGASNLSVNSAEAARAVYRETQDIAHVRQMFPRADPAVAVILGKANTRRRQILHYKDLYYESAESTTVDAFSSSSIAEGGEGKKTGVVPTALTETRLGKTPEAERIVDFLDKVTTDDESGSENERR